MLCIFRSCDLHIHIALQVLHEPPMLFHRDIRWPNVVRHAEDPSLWFLIDWDDAAGSNNAAAHHLDERSHSPQVFQNNHGGEVDIWGVGKLIEDSAGVAFNISPELVNLGKVMMQERPTAREALGFVKKYASQSRTFCV